MEKDIKITNIKEKKLYTHESYATMDIKHEDVNNFGFEHLNIKHDDSYLDIGCGSGKNIKRFLEKAKDGHAVGIDISDVAVSLSKEENSSNISKGKCEIYQENIDNFEYKPNSFSLVGAFCTVRFWEHLKSNFETVYNVTKKGGTFLICDHGQYDVEEIVELLISVGFKKVVLETLEPDISCLIATK